MAQRPDVEAIPADLDRFLGNFFNSRGWRSEIKYDPSENRLYLEVRLASGRLCGDDRFFSLVEYYSRAQDALLRQRSGIKLQCRLFATDGRELTAELHSRGSSYLDNDRRGSWMRRRLAWLGFRRRFFARVIPAALLWAVALVVVVDVFGLPAGVAIAIACIALLVQAVVVSLGSRRG